MVNLTESKLKRKQNSDSSYGKCNVTLVTSVDCSIRVSILICVLCTVELTVDLTKYLQNCASKLCSKSKSVSELLLLLKPANEDSSSAAAMVTDGHSAGEPMDANDDSGRKSSISTSTSSEISEVTKWSYCTRLTDWLYHVS